MNWSLMIAMASLLISAHQAVTSWREKHIRLKGYLSGFVVNSCPADRCTYVGLICTLQNLSARYCEIHGADLETCTGLRLFLLSRCEIQDFRELSIEDAAHLDRAPSALQIDFPVSIAPYRARRMMLWAVLDDRNEPQSDLLSALLSHARQESSIAYRKECSPIPDGACEPATKGTGLPGLSLCLSCIPRRIRVPLRLRAPLSFSLLRQ